MPNFYTMMTYVGRPLVNETHTLLDVAGAEAVRARAVQLHQLDPVVLEPALAGTLFPDEPDDLLAQIRCPVHLLAAQSSLDGAMDVWDVQRAVSRMPHCTYAFVEGAGHDIHLDRPEAFMVELKRFLMAVQSNEPESIQGQENDREEMTS